MTFQHFSLVHACHIQVVNNLPLEALMLGTEKNKWSEHVQICIMKVQYQVNQSKCKTSARFLLLAGESRKATKRLTSPAAMELVQHGGCVSKHNQIDCDLHTPARR